MTSPQDLALAADRLALPTLAGLGDDEVMALQRRLGSVRQRVDTAAAEVAAEIARRSRRELGYRGLAQRTGARTPERLVQTLTGSSAREARALVETGRMLSCDSEESPAGEPLLARALREGVLTVEQCRAITIGLGAPDERIAESDLDGARAELVALAASVTVEDLRTHARVLRDELDAAGVAGREEALREKRYLRLFRQEDGMTRLVALLDPESAARVQTVVDAALSPRRAGPRFVDPDEVVRAERLVSDPRTNDQIALDAVVELLDAGTAAAPANDILGRNGAPVHVLVSAKDLAAGRGAARIAGQESAVSIATAERRICADGSLPIVFDESGRNVLRLGRRRRRFSAAQRAALVARDGGCRMCGRPASQCEAHHRIPWSRGGPTDLDNAILLCRFHHLLVHNNGWEIEVDVGGDMWFVPPADADPLRRRIAAHPPNPIVRRLAG